MHDRIIRLLNEGKFKRLAECFSLFLTEESAFLRKSSALEIREEGHQNLVKFLIRIFDSHPDGIFVHKSRDIYDLSPIKAIHYELEFRGTITGPSPLLETNCKIESISELLDRSAVSLEEVERMKEEEAVIIQRGHFVLGTFRVFVSLFYDATSRRVISISLRSSLVSISDSNCWM